jgi:glycosyltransferase involved in cell wall biosynthesis
MKLSVVLNTFNRPEYTRLALISLKHQSRLPDEVVVSDDGSHDSQLPILRELAPTLPFRLLFVTHEHNGFQLARCRNNGILASGGDYLAFMDQDLLLTHDYLDIHCRHASSGSFLVPQVIILSEKQSGQITPEQIEQGVFNSILSGEQLGKNRGQYREDAFYRLARHFGYKTHRPKLKGGLFSIYRHDILKVNGYDEEYRGWGNEDDDLGRRLYAVAIPGRNPFKNDYALHMYHEPNHGAGERRNLEYYTQRKQRISSGEYVCDKGLQQRLETDLDCTVIQTGAS